MHLLHISDYYYIPSILERNVYIKHYVTLATTCSVHVYHVTWLHCFFLWLIAFSDALLSVAPEE